MPVRARVGLWTVERLVDRSIQESDTLKTGDLLDAPTYSLFRGCRNCSQSEKCDRYCNLSNESVDIRRNNKHFHFITRHQVP